MIIIYLHAATISVISLCHLLSFPSSIAWYVGPRPSNSSACVCSCLQHLPAKPPSTSITRLWMIMAIVTHLHATMWSSFDIILTHRPRRHWNQLFQAPMQCSDWTQSWEAVLSKSAFSGWRQYRCRQGHGLPLLRTFDFLSFLVCWGPRHFRPVSQGNMPHINPTSLLDYVICLLHHSVVRRVYWYQQGFDLRYVLGARLQCSQLSASKYYRIIPVFNKLLCWV